MSRSNAVKPQKISLRRRFFDRRDELSASEAAQASAALCRRLSHQSPVCDASVLAGYMAKVNEIDLREYLTSRMEEGVEVVLPRITGPGEMEFCRITSWEELRPGPFGIEEPSGPARPIESIEVFLVPGLAFDLRGHRLGFGKGFYDRALPEPGAAVAVGIGHDWQLISDRLPAEDHDRAMDFVLTDRTWHKPSGDTNPTKE